MKSPSVRGRSDRRHFIRTATLLPLAAAAFPAAAFRAAAGIAPVRRAGGPRLKTALNAYSFLELLNARAADPAKGIDLLEVCEFCAKHDFDAVDVTGRASCFCHSGRPNAGGFSPASSSWGQ